MNKKITIVLPGSWVFRHRSDDVLPIPFLADFIKSNLQGQADVVKATLTELHLTVTDGQDVTSLTETIRKEFMEHYEIQDNDILSVTVEDLTDDKDSDASEPTEDTDKAVSAEEKPSDDEAVFNKGGVIPDDEEEDEDKSDSDEAVKKDGTAGDEEKKDEDEDEDDDEDTGFGFLRRGRRREEKKKVEDPEKVMARIDRLIGADEFKALAREITCIAPQIKANNTYSVFASRGFVFSVNSGYGLSTYLKELSNLLSALGLRKNLNCDGINEIVLGAPKGDSLDPFDSVLSALRYGSDDVTRVLCVDISEWLNSLNTGAFRTFLGNVAENMQQFVVVFRVPFVDKDVLERVRFALNDMLFVRMVSFPPFNNSEIRKYAQTEITQYGFRMSSAAWTNFDHRLAEEKADGKFYGIKTISKVVGELLYVKQLSNARRGKNDLCISKKDTAALCSEQTVEGLTAEQMLDSLVGSESIKARIFEIVSQIVYASSATGVERPCIHMRFVGNPGTGKTTVARIIGKLLKENGILRIGEFHEHAGRDLCGRYIGETAPKTASICRDAYGSVLFLDEAYTLYRGDNNDRDYGREALDTLIAEMENHRNDMVIIMAGYADEMEILMHGNAGLASRMPYVIEFPNFTRDQLYDIFVSMIGNRFKYDEALLPAVKAYFDTLPDSLLNSKEFSNARFVRNLFERTWAKAAMRCQLSKISDVSLTKDDFDRSTQDREFKFMNESKKKNRIGFYD